MTPAPCSRSSHALRLAAPLLLLAGGCLKYTTDDFPLSVGFTPLEPLVPEATWPAPTATDPHPQALGPIVPGPRIGHNTAHARAYVHASLATVYQALKDPATSHIHPAQGDWTVVSTGAEPFPVSFVIHYRDWSSPFTVSWDVTYRAGPLEGTEAAPTVVGLRYQKTHGIENIYVQAGSLEAREVDAGVTSLEFVAWLQATNTDQGTVEGTVQDMYDNMLAKLAAMATPAGP